MTNTSLEEFVKKVQEDKCDCDQRCPKCGKIKDTHSTWYPMFPTYPPYTYPYTYPSWFVNTCTTSGCDHD